MSRESSRVAIDCFEQAIRADPNAALAYAGLAEAHVANFALLPREEAARRAREAARQALAIDPALGAAYAALGQAHFMEWDWAGAERNFRPAVELGTGVDDAKSALRGRTGELPG